MLPSLLARDIRTSLKQFLMAAYEPGDRFFQGLMTRFAEDETQWLKGPYVQVGLPFVPGKAGRTFFADFQTQHPAHDHQEKAWERLSSRHRALSTLIATGTGSGKTECFLYPVLDHAARARAGGEKGIKALIIYPMNALATDQARRIAELVDSIPAFKQLRVGLYVGGSVANPGEGMLMAPTHVITDRDTLRKNPPDILLTNYKMLDYLMLRPKDRQLWESNGPETLRYVVVDELHTFDGAQGTDLALLLRRLRARLKIPEDHLICAGTSATLGHGNDTTALRDYARQIFSTAFDTDSVIMENRRSVASFLDEATVEYMFLFQPALVPVLSPDAYASPEAAVQAWYPLFFNGEAAPADVKDRAWRRSLGERLKQHQLFVNLLKLLRSGVVPYSDLKQSFARSMPTATPQEVEKVLDALLVLVAWALRENNLPLVTLRMQLWVRELRRMVSKVVRNSAELRLVPERDLPADRGGVYLPLLQCNQCRTTGWLSRRPPAHPKLSSELDKIYEAWFRQDPEAVRIYALESETGDHADGIRKQLCTSCGTLQNGADICGGCGQRELLGVFLATGSRQIQRQGANITRHDDTCPSCGAHGALILLGARNATLGAQVIDASWASLFNDDKKLIAFSDSVQDAAHRAGFFGARTWQNNVRTAWVQSLDMMGASGKNWSKVLELAEAQFTSAGSVLCMPKETLVAEFLAPDMTWQRGWSELRTNEALPAGSRLPDKVKKRLLWQLFSDLTYQSQRGRSLERIGKAVLTVPWERVERVTANLLPVFGERLGIRELSGKQISQWLWGMLTHMRQRGGVMHPMLIEYAQDENHFKLISLGGRGEWMPRMAKGGPRPVFLSATNQGRFDKLRGTGAARSWYEKWGFACFESKVLLNNSLLADMYSIALKALQEDGVLELSGTNLGLSGEALVLRTDLAFVTTRGNTRRLAVPRNEAEPLLGMPSLEDLRSPYVETIPDAAGWWSDRFSRGDLKRVIAAEHTGLLPRPEREALEARFKAKKPQPWYENLLSATPTLEMGVDIGDLSSVLLCSVPPNQASFLQRIGRAGRRDGNAMTTTLADGNSPHDLYFFAETEEMIAGPVEALGVFLKAVEVLRRQLFAFCMDDWVAGLKNLAVLPDKTSPALDAVEQVKIDRFPYVFLDHVVTNQVRLFDGFVSLLGSDADKVVIDRLRDFIEGQGEDDGLKIRLMKTLQDLVRERKVWRERKEEVDRQRIKAEQGPQDQATQNTIAELISEKNKILELVKEINTRDLLNTLTDAGLIPNYAFPEAGIELKSVLWRRKGDDDTGPGKYVTLETLKYERPANSALSEFAPENRFYANQRKVEIDQINMSLTSTEEWRFCPACQHVQNLSISVDEYGTCPRCSDALWGNVSQKRTLLRFRQAIANSDDSQVRIDDAAEEREPAFYTRQLLANFEPSTVREAWQLPDGMPPFGFEFLARVTFRDINFGEISNPGDTFKVADREAPRPGFKLCRDCGKVQSSYHAEEQHSLDCPHRSRDNPDALIECLYLYREFTSEALRILVPFTKYGVDEKVIQSFMAAIQLGLKRCFGGKVDHLRMTLQDEPGQDNGPRRQFVLLYDSVPGGTGYLNELLAHEADALDRVFKESLAALDACSCNKDPEKDGCYRCLYQYRIGRSLDEVSRSIAQDVLRELTGALHAKVRVKTISQIYINPNFDSVLEARFIECLRKLSGIGKLPPITLLQDIVFGKSGFILQVGPNRYRVEPQRNLASSDGITVPSKPDFIIWPWSESSTRKPVAVFCDGWTYHKSTLQEDARKRSALLASSRYVVWSITHEDITTSIGGGFETDLPSTATTLNRHDSLKAATWFKPSEVYPLSQNAVAQLLHHLASPENDVVAEGSLRRNAASLVTRLLPTTPEDQEAAKAQMNAWKALIPEWLKHSGKHHTAFLSVAEAPVTVVGWWAHTLLSGPSAATPVPGFVILDESSGDGEQGLHLRWRQWLQACNIFQFLPGMLMATKRGLVEGDYGLFEGAAELASHQQSEMVPPGLWRDAVQSCAPFLKPALLKLEKHAVRPPEVGMELAGPDGTIVAECEAAWPEKKLVLLRSDQDDMAKIWSDEGWMVVQMQDENQTVDGTPIELALAKALGVSGAGQKDATC
ncbi:DEAD/DEAH box helicase [Aestuariivirga litoralis]|uniref:DEAD/DEAH box helicase n=1 Tax=Aestuariivirga litoralis TaxID=2650924 RepID=A0A2W2B676_9HYPH|nr:DEAD/DEAH box helicase [Aestuariivirga litoralis]PZF75824.1 DEAD/DEAH box helicase [Aestuariivirga litoralis]